MQSQPQGGVNDRDARVRLEREASVSFQFIWRTLRRLGVRPDEAVDDAVQRVFEIAAHKRDVIEPGSERAFLFKAAVLVAAEERRGARRQQSRIEESGGGSDGLSDSCPGPEELLDARRRRQVLDGILDTMQPPLRTVFVLFEMEGMSSPQIAQLLGIPEGTVASRLRRAREAFQEQARRARARMQLAGGGP
jgi:RNA polymerase sigma-70 factor, ECF subfamily